MSRKPLRQRKCRRDRRQSTLPALRLVLPHPSRRSLLGGERRLGRWCAIHSRQASCWPICRTAAMAAARPLGPRPTTSRRRPNPPQPLCPRQTASRPVATHLVATPTVLNKLTWFNASLRRGQVGVKSRQLGHRLGPCDVSFEAKRFRHFAIPTHQVAVGNIVTTASR
jgi:hypothetical protein